jgi:hypothetical protein
MCGVHTADRAAPDDADADRHGYAEQSLTMSGIVTDMRLACERC